MRCLLAVSQITTRTDMRDGRSIEGVYGDSHHSLQAFVANDEDLMDFPTETSSKERDWRENGCPYEFTNCLMTVLSLSPTKTPIRLLPIHLWNSFFQFWQGIRTYAKFERQRSRTFTRETGQAMRHFPMTGFPWYGFCSMGSLMNNVQERSVLTDSVKSTPKQSSGESFPSP